MDAADEKSHPMEKAKEPAYFSLACTKILRTRLLRSLKESNTSPVAERWEWEMLCPICESFLGYWICAVDISEITLSANQQRKNRNTALLAKSHYKKYHALGKAISLIQSHEHVTNAPAAQAKPSQVTPVAPTATSNTSRTQSGCQTKEWQFCSSSREQDIKSTKCQRRSQAGGLRDRRVRQIRRIKRIKRITRIRYLS